MKESSQDLSVSGELEEPKSFSLGQVFIELVVQFWQLITDTVTGYQRLVWLRQRQHTRAQLLDFSDEQLKDIGISRVDAQKEANKPFWE